MYIPQQALSLYFSLSLETWEQACVSLSLSLSPWADHPHKETPCLYWRQKYRDGFFWWMGLADYHLCQCQNHKPALAKEGKRERHLCICLSDVFLQWHKSIFTISLSARGSWSWRLQADGPIGFLIDLSFFRDTSFLFELINSIQ